MNKIIMCITKSYAKNGTLKKVSELYEFKDEYNAFEEARIQKEEMERNEYSFEHWKIDIWEERGNEKIFSGNYKRWSWEKQR